VIDVGHLKSRLAGTATHCRNRSEAVVSNGGEPGRQSAQISWEQNCGWFIADFCIDLDR
jgi:hypothetical protein